MRSSKKKHFFSINGTPTLNMSPVTAAGGPYVCNRPEKDDDIVWVYKHKLPLDNLQYSANACWYLLGALFRWIAVRWNRYSSMVRCKRRFVLASAVNFDFPVGRIGVYRRKRRASPRVSKHSSIRNLVDVIYGLGVLPSCSRSSFIVSRFSSGQIRAAMSIMPFRSL